VTNHTQQNDNGLNLKNTDAIDYMLWMRTEAAKYNMQTSPSTSNAHN
jgi:hypothetical protein